MTSKDSSMHWKAADADHRARTVEGQMRPTKEREAVGRVKVEGYDGEALDPEGMRVTRAKETHESLMDVLLEREKLGPWEQDGRGKRRPGKDAQRRYDAALWLRRCHTRAGLHPRTTSVLEGAQGKRHVSDAEAWNHKAFNEAMREMRQYAGIVRGAAVENQIPRSMIALLFGLDMLAKHRGID